MAVRRIRFGILGPVTLHAGERPVPLTGRRGRAVLAVLLLAEGRPVAREELIDRVWGQKRPRTVENQLHIAVHRLRTAIDAAGADGRRVLRRTGGGYVLRLPETAECDLTAFRALVAEAIENASSRAWPETYRALTAAERLWRGPVAEGLIAQGEALGEEQATARQWRLAAGLLAGEFATVIAEARARLRIHPLRERLWHALILGLALSGRGDTATAVRRHAGRVLSTAAGLAPGPELRKLAGRLAGGDFSGALDDVANWIPGTGRAEDRTSDLLRRPMQLPSEVRQFVGRGAELDGLSAALSPAPNGTVPVIVVSGLGGVGKSALAVRAARTAGSRYPDGCLFTDLRGADEQPADPHRVMGSFLRSLGLSDDAVPNEPAERTGLYRAVLADRRVILVLDNAADAGQVEPLLPDAPGCAVIVTGRRSLTPLPATHRTTLGALPAEDAGELIARLSGRDDVASEQVVDLVALTGGLPLALRILAARLARRRTLTAPRLIERLTDERHRLDELADGDRGVRACIEFAYRGLGAEAARVLRWAGLLPVGRFSPGLLAASLGMTGAAVRGHVDELIDAQLLTEVEGDAAGERFAVHDLVRVFARRIVREAGADPDPAEARHRMHRTLAELAAVADEALPFHQYYVPERRGGTIASSEDAAAVARRAPAAWFAAEQDLLLAVVGDARTEASTTAELATAMTNHLIRTAQVDELDAVWTAAESRAAPSPAAAATRRYGRVKVFREEDRNGDAMTLARRLRLEHRRAGRLREAAAVAVDLSIAHRALGDYRSSRAAVEWACRFFDGLADPPAPIRAQRGWAHLALANVLFFDDLDTAAGHVDEALADFRAVGEIAGEANALGVRAVTLQRRREYAEAVAVYTEVIAIERATGQVLGSMRAQQHLVTCLLFDGRLDRAREVAEEMTAGARLLRNKQYLATSLRLAAVVERESGRPSAALPLLRRALECGRDLQAPEGVALIHRSIAQTHLALGDRERARTAAQKGLALLADGHPARRSLEDLAAGRQSNRM